MNLNNLWPFVLLMPSDVAERVRFLQTLFSSPVTIEILLLFDKEKRLCQKDIVETLKHHSNKTIISTLKKLVKLGLLKEFKHFEYRGKRVVRLKCYELTDVGYWYNIFLKDVKMLDQETLHKLISEIISLFLSRLTILKDYLYKDYNEFMNKAILNLLKSMYVKTLAKFNPDVVVFGSIALDIYLNEKLMIFSGGSGANVASNCSRLGLKTVFITKLFSDVLSLKLSTELLDEGIDISLSQLEIRSGTPVCIINKWYTEDPKIRCYFDVDNPPVVAKLNDDIISICNKTKVIYLGEGVCNTYLQLLEKIEKNNKIVIYRPSESSLEKYFDECKEVLKHNPLLVLNSRKYGLLRRIGIKVPDDLIKLGVENIIVTKGSQGVVIYTNGRVVKVPAKTDVKIIDTVGAGDLFVASLIYNIIQGLDIVEASRKACNLASQAVTILGPRKLALLSQK